MEIFTGFVLRQFTVCLFLDIKRIFNNIIPKLLLYDLIELGLSPKICWLIYNLISLRKIRFCVNGEISDPYLSRKSLPQGSILSLLLFNIYAAKTLSHSQL